jgi:hypothetical protein
VAFQLNSDAIVKQAHTETGLDEFDSDSYREGLEVLVSSLNEADCPEDGLRRCHDDFANALKVRLQVAKYLADHPDIVTRPVERPVFVFGIPRTGTSLLSNLLAADPHRRSPLHWEIDEPVPPPTTEHLYDDPRALARIEREKDYTVELQRIRPRSAILPNEDVYIMAHDFKSLMWEARGKLPRYREWIFSTDLTSAYEYHRKFLQLLQSDAPGVWNLKMPSHALFLQSLVGVFPDARLVWTHRDPLTATASFCAMGGGMKSPWSTTSDLEYTATWKPWQAQQHVDRAMDARAAIGHDRIVDVYYAEMMRDPISTMRTLYAALGDEFTPEAETAMRAWLVEHPQHKFGRREYDLSQFGLAADQVRPRFERYLSEYDIEPEG